MRRLAIVVVAALALLLPQTVMAKTALLYNVHASSARVANGRIVLPAASTATWFAVHPARRTGTTTLGAIVGVWDASGFAASPPNAALVMTSGGTTSTHVVTLSKPQRNGSTVSFRYRAVPNGVEAGQRTSGPLAAGRYGSSDLYIDDVMYPPCGAVLASGATCLLDISGLASVSVARGHVDVCSVGSAAGQIYISWYTDNPLGVNPVSTGSPPLCPATFSGGEGSVGAITVSGALFQRGIVRVTSRP